MSDPGPSLAGAARRKAAATAGRLRPDRRDLATALMILAATPVAAAVVTQVAVLAEQARAERLEQRHRPRLAAIAAAQAAVEEAERLRPLLARPTISALSARFAAALPEGARLAALSIDAEGVIAAEIDCTDPDQLADALAADPLLARLDPIGQRPAAAEGVRVNYSTPRP